MNFVDTIINSKRSVIFLSPHLDDAILSCGALLSYLKDKIPLKIVTIFTRVSHPPETKFAKKFILSCGYKNSKSLFKNRRDEDRHIFKLLKVKHQHLSFTDAAWRKYKENMFLKFLGNIKAENVHLYPTEKALFSGQIHKSELKLKNKIKKKLNSIFKGKDLLVFAPLGVGSHVDHILVRDICAEHCKSIIYWKDFPYSIYKGPDTIFIRNNNLVEHHWSKNLSKKKQLIAMYKTQFKSLFPSGNPSLTDETYFFRNL